MDVWISLQVVAPTIASPACQEQLIESAKLVANSVEGIVESSQTVCRDDRLLQDLGGAATAVTQALNDLLQHIKRGAGQTQVRDMALWSVRHYKDKCCLFWPHIICIFLGKPKSSPYFSLFFSISNSYFLWVTCHLYYLSIAYTYACLKDNLSIEASAERHMSLGSGVICM